MRQVVPQLSEYVGIDQETISFDFVVDILISLGQDSSLGGSRSEKPNGSVGRVNLVLIAIKIRKGSKDLGEKLGNQT